MLFEGKAGFTLTEKPVADNAKTGHLLCGEEYGRIFAETSDATPAEANAEENSAATPDEAAESAEKSSVPAENEAEATVSAENTAE